ncbi:MarC family protein [Kribbella sp. GL6]|uniref:MarC family protein n=1 Tax=Kribbella sp. GL6 TaxID=3419765 RepID=UPI003D0897A6
MEPVHVAAATAVLAAAVALRLWYGAPLVDRLGPTGAGALTRLIGFLTLAIGVEPVTHGVLATRSSGSCWGCRCSVVRRPMTADTCCHQSRRRRLTASC